jgi:hypothetical protein
MTEFPQRTRIAIAIDYKILSKRYDDEVLPVTPNGHSPPGIPIRLTDLNICY